MQAAPSVHVALHQAPNARSLVGLRVINAPPARGWMYGPVRGRSARFQAEHKLPAWIVRGFIIFAGGFFSPSLSAVCGSDFSTDSLTRGVSTSPARNCMYVRVCFFFPPFFSSSSSGVSPCDDGDLAGLCVVSVVMAAGQTTARLRQWEQSMRDVSGNLQFCFVGLGVHVQSATVCKILSLIWNRPFFIDL